MDAFRSILWLLNSKFWCFNIQLEAGEWTTTYQYSHLRQWKNIDQLWALKCYLHWLFNWALIFSRQSELNFLYKRKSEINRGHKPNQDEVANDVSCRNLGLCSHQLHFGCRRLHWEVQHLLRSARSNWTCSTKLSLCLRQWIHPKDLSIYTCMYITLRPSRSWRWMEQIWPKQIHVKHSEEIEFTCYFVSGADSYKIDKIEIN